MSSALKPTEKSLFVPSNTVQGKRVAILVSEWHSEITDALYAGAMSVLTETHLASLAIRQNVPGSFELSLASQYMALRPDVDAVICLGCVVQGETKHFDFICSALAHGLTEVSLKYNKPVAFGVITSNTYAQAEERAGGKYGNKGEEAAWAVVKMLNIA